jgi:hypothetical protein
MKRAQKKSRHGKKHNWTTPTVLGLALSVLGLVGLIELRPQMDVVPQEPLEHSQALTTPFRIQDAGYLSLDIKRVFCYVHEIKFSSPSIKEGKIGNTTARMRQAENVVLETGESETIFCHLLNEPIMPDKADMAVVVDYKVWIVPWTLRKYKRFIGANGDHWEWLSEPLDDIEPEIDKQINDHFQSD